MAEYRPIKGFLGYLVGDDGSVWSRRYKNSRAFLPRYRRLKPFPNSNGYSCFSAPGIKSLEIHKVVLETFVGPCPAGMECCHNDGNRSNCRLDNLRWDTRKNNNADQKLHGTFRYGDNHHCSKLSSEIVRDIRELYVDGKSKRELASVYGVNWQTIHDVITGRTWSHVE